VLPRLVLARQASIDAVRTHAQKVARRGAGLYRLRGDCIAAILAGHGPPVWHCLIVCSLSNRRSAVELQEEKMVDPERLAFSS
jgi:hypothetical protein